jgi:hypothetical protein
VQEQQRTLEEEEPHLHLNYPAEEEDSASNAALDQSAPMTRVRQTLKEYRGFGSEVREVEPKLTSGVLWMHSPLHPLPKME